MVQVSIKLLLHWELILLNYKVFDMIFPMYKINNFNKIFVEKNQDELKSS